jgi:signal transduction histidine kinase/DNA-binding response OmpR family regulator
LEKKALLTIEEYQARISELEKTIRKRDREISRLQTGIEQEKIFANVNANMIAAKTIAQRIRDRYLQLLLDNSSDIIICFDYSRRIVFCSSVLLKLTGTERGLESGRQADELFRGICDDRCIETIKTNLYGVLADNKARYVPLEICLSRSTEIRKYVIKFIPMRSDEGGSEGVMVIFNDVTGIERAREDAEMASAAKSEFLLDMSHEIRTPLNAIIGMTAIAIKSDNVDRREYCLKKIEDASTHLLDVINDILDISKIETNKLELSPESFIFEKMIQKAVNMINYQAEEKHQFFSVNINDNIPYTLTGDSKRLIQIITNLLSNAVKFTPESGSVRLDARLAAAENGVYTVQIEVTDSGIGISADNQSRLFHSFHQANSGGASRKFSGGMGLAISRHLVDMMGGRIWVDSELGMGATFGFTFMAKQGADNDNKLFSNNDYWAGKRALVVDNAPNTLVYFRGEASRLSISCDIALSGEAALEQIEKNGAYDIYFIDWKMQGMNGIETAAKIREMSAGKPKPSIAVMISAAEWKLVEADAKTAGVEYYLQKPLFRSDIFDCLNFFFGAKTAVEARDKTDNFEGFRILLVEDLEINREIVLAHLEHTRLAIDCAANGKIAVKMVMDAEKPYDIIFMDLQMPEMDGYEAAYNIRRFEGSRYGGGNSGDGHTPIIAMTASVFREDIEKCLEAGMNDHIGLPLDDEEVLKKLRSYLKPMNTTTA